jgi:hypothetical protein
VCIDTPANILRFAITAVFSQPVFGPTPGRIRGTRRPVHCLVQALAAALRMAVSGTVDRALGRSGGGIIGAGARGRRTGGTGGRPIIGSEGEWDDIMFYRISV